MYQEFPKNRYKVMRGQTSGRGKQGFSYKCYIFLHNIATVVTNCLYKVHEWVQNNLKIPLSKI